MLINNFLDSSSLAPLKNSRLRHWSKLKHDGSLKFIHDNKSGELMVRYFDVKQYYQETSIKVYGDDQKDSCSKLALLNSFDFPKKSRLENDESR